MRALLDQVPWSVAVILALTLGLAPFTPEPHLVEKLRMLGAGTLTRPIDILDLALHGAPWVLLMAKGWTAVRPKG
ncbi:MULTISPECIES: RND transporter [unclassified Rhodosalinus]|uniref:RND transporter n=1 Tax=unclassified Rhodosalinus TaxID=2630183 RepID=UPI003523A903